MDSLEEYLHSLWHKSYQLSRHIPHETPDHGHLVLDILRTQGKGPLTRPAPGLYGTDIACTVDGTLWYDLPFLVADMTDFWIDNCVLTVGAPRLNFVLPLVILVSTQASRDRLCQIALVVFRMTFEHRRNLPNRASGILTLCTYYPLLLSGSRKQSVTSFNSQRSHDIIVSAMLARVARCSSNRSLGGDHMGTDSKDCMEFYRRQKRLTRHT